MVGEEGQRFLVHADNEDIGAVLQHVLGAVAVVDIEVDDGDAVQAVVLDEVVGCQGDVAEQAKAHGFAGLGVVSGRADGTEGVVDLAGHDHVDGLDDAADRELGDVGAIRADG